MIAMLPLPTGRMTPFTIFTVERCYLCYSFSSGINRIVTGPYCPWITM